MRVGGTGWNRDAGLSEVVGFVLIIALLMAVFSLYLTYGVPAQGRENEILHMGVVKDQFIAYKIGLDSLSTNNKVDTTLSNSFSLGSEGGYTQGGVMGFIPIMNPVSSGGTFSINRRTTEPETLTITSRSLIVDSSNTTFRTSENLPAEANYTPSHVYANVTIGPSAVLDRTSSFGMVVNTTQWVATVNLTPRQTYYLWYDSQTGTQVNCLGRSNNGTPIWIDLPGATDTCLVPMYAYNYTGTDITLSISKGSTLLMDKYPVYTNVQRGVTYAVDLMDSTYGLTSEIEPLQSLNLKVDRPMSQVTGNGNLTYNFIETTYQITPITLGAIDYKSQNHYWISQEYYYQMGGVFLSQIDGNNTYKLPPEISFSLDNSDPSRPFTRVTINAMSITNPYGGSVVGGNSPVQIKTTLDSVYNLPYATGKANTKWIRIAVNTSDEQARGMWKNYFDYTATVAGIPDTETGITGTESFIRIGYTDYVSNPTKDYDINVVASNATYTALLYGVGG